MKTDECYIIMFVMKAIKTRVSLALATQTKRLALYYLII